MTNQKGGRTLPITIEDLMNSVRLKLAVENFPSDKMLLKAILVELCLEVMKVTKSTVIKRYNTYNSLDSFEMLPLLREIDVDDLITFNIFWSLSPLETALYQTDPKFKLSPEERTVILNKVRKQLMHSNGS